MAKKSKHTLLKGYTRLPGSSKRVRTPTGQIISDRAYHRISTEQKLTHGGKATSKRAKAIRAVLKREGRLRGGRHYKPTGTSEEALRQGFRNGYRMRLRTSGNTHETFATFELFERWWRQHLHGSGQRHMLRNAPEWVEA